ncbi:dihydroneopterin aldolase [Sphingomonas sp. HT-1]|uniref:dihydroneopterin aldolase n=1 Tax=unclassified Sphingomonas TaxID=196159 RepID=UPI0003161F23|nr:MULTISPECIES: dihydroneopterin aldolase [unclassified Sphingomonas]KTF69059.1 dihydroneopterin aldolase [Sphingomonas sp. WG]
MPDYVIHLEALDVIMGLGIHPHERAAPQRVRIDVAMTCRYPAIPEDRIDAVVDYDFLREGIHALVASRHFELQEVLCEEIARLALRDRRVAEVRVRSAKQDVYPDARVGCEIIRSSAD